VPTLYNRFRLPGVNLFSTTAVLVKSSVRFRYYHHSLEPTSKITRHLKSLTLERLTQFFFDNAKAASQNKTDKFLVSNVDVSSIVNAKLIKCF